MKDVVDAALRWSQAAQMDGACCNPKLQSDEVVPHMLVNQLLSRHLACRQSSSGLRPCLIVFCCLLGSSPLLHGYYY